MHLVEVEEVTPAQARVIAAADLERAAECLRNDDMDHARWHIQSAAIWLRDLP